MEMDYNMRFQIGLRHKHILIAIMLLSSCLPYLVTVCRDGIHSLLLNWLDMVEKFVYKWARGLYMGSLQ